MSHLSLPQPRRETAPTLEPTMYYEQQPAVPIAEEPSDEMTQKINEKKENSDLYDGNQDKSAYVEKVIFPLIIRPLILIFLIPKR